MPSPTDLMPTQTQAAPRFQSRPEDSFPIGAFVSIPGTAFGVVLLIGLPFSGNCA